MNIMHMIVNDFESNKNSNQFKNEKWVDNKSADSKGKKERSDKEQVVISFGGGRITSRVRESHKYSIHFSNIRPKNIRIH